jgi:hypothetical protein
METITITIKEYNKLKERDKFLSKLEAAGVDNWEGYGGWDTDEEEED